MQEEYSPVLQIVHVSDLHVKTMTATVNHSLSSIARAALRRIRKHNLYGWKEGTQGNFPLAPAAFERFLRTMKARDTEWSDIPTWLIDTGDRSTFGDHDSLAAGEKYLMDWADALGGCDYRSLYGNHDAWPGILPILAPGGINSQRRHVQQQRGWNPPNWIDQPLSIDILDGSAAIELFAADTVCWNVRHNTCAVGKLEEESINSIHAKLKNRGPKKSLRILATHHPIAFPWRPGETSANGFETMRLLNEDICTRWFSNEDPFVDGLGPWFHLFLSGHTHRAHPGHGLSSDVVAIRQASLGDHQLQLVAGPLMLNQQTTDSVTHAAVKNFSPATVDVAPCQAQILRFYASHTQPAIKILRLGIYSHDGGANYAFGENSAGVLTLYYDTP